MSESLEALKQHSSILDLYASRLKLTKQAKDRYRAECPFGELHKNGVDRTPSLDVFLDKGTWIFKCLGCGTSDSIFGLLQQTDKVPFKDAVRIAREFTSGWFKDRGQVESVFKSVGQEKDKPLKTFPESDYVKLEEAFAQSKEAQAFLLKERGIDLQTAKRLRVGFRQDVGKLAGESHMDISAKGWLSFPTLHARLVTSVKYRSIVGKYFCKQPGMGTYLWNTESLDFCEPIFLCEGELDAMTLEMSGVRAVSLPNATCTVTPEWKDMLLSAECVILAGDNDGAAGTKKMQQLWAEMQERTFYLKWPGSCKDANEFFLTVCNRNLSVFRTKVNELTQLAKSTPMPGIYSLQEMMVSRAEDNIADHPHRFRFPWANVDAMAILAPGAVIGFTATNTGMGKTTFIIQATLESARKHGEVVLNYQAELSQEQISRMVASQVLFKHRLELSKADYNQAAELIGSAKYYIGRNPTLTTITPVLDLIEAGVRRLSPTVVVLDNLHFLCRFEPDQVKAMENAMQRIKNMAATYNLKFFVLGAPKKADSTNKGKSLHISDVRGSASFGDDSDAVFTLHRDIIKDRETNKKDEYEPATKIRLVKVRDKGPGDAEVDLVFIGERATFSEVTYQEQSGQMSYEYAK